MTRGPRERLWGWIRIAALAAIAVIAALLLLGCGEDDDGSSAADTTTGAAGEVTPDDRAPQKPEASPGRAVRAFLDAYARGDGEEVCRHMTGGLRRRVATNGGCISRKLHLLPAETQRVADGEITDDRARILTVNHERLQAEYGLVLKGDSWRIRTVRRRGRTAKGEEASLR